MSRYEVDSAQLDGSAAAVLARSASIQAEVSAMQRQLVELQSTWRGGAAGQFGAVVTEWNATQARVEQSLAQIAAAMQAAARTYAEAEAHASRLFAH
ncbi:WXG100 family type VII secretion target [Cellulomonas sp. B6]|jgi:WXG100 family type VII secretion target|uniref:WXG100 family type VII secretion target n=1 Tax=Cellulomonas sp. B6 TaxID=1295626 RepID=UPI00073C15F0|nr:WXG100 family type VII secretion target [Cellulomonas sp. B6]KSW30337.1 type VII secretion protein [Cellulomonas sp. B6]